MKQAPAPIETKVAAGGTASLTTGMITWLLVTLVPSWHHGLPVLVANYLPYAVSTISGMIAAYLAPHTSRPSAVAPPPATEPVIEKSAA